ncbi:MAG: hypothetical protein AAF708_16565 [Deinococcota bacterium]
MLAVLSLALALLAVAVVYGTDVFFAVVGRAALANSSDAAVAEVIGNIHAVADVRMPFFAATGLLGSILSLLFVGISQPRSVVMVLVIVLLLVHMGLYFTQARPINRQFVSAVQCGNVLAEARTLQQTWDQIVVIRAVLLTFAMMGLIILILSVN